jgi:hypothetical protein
MITISILTLTIYLLGFLFLGADTPNLVMKGTKP